MADDLNMRVLKSLASGIVLLTNCLSRETSLELLFTDRRHMAPSEDDPTWKSLSKELRNSRLLTLAFVTP